MNFCVRAFVFFIVSLCWAGLCLRAQPAQLDFRQYNTDDGLPSSEIYTIHQDVEGYIWLGTDNGLARFDGYEFVVFDADDGLKDAVIFSIVTDNNGKLWVSTLSGRVYYLEGDQFFPYAFNDELNLARESARFVNLLDVMEDQSMVFSVSHSNRIFRVDTLGLVEPLSGFEDAHLYIYEPGNGRLAMNRSIAHNYAFRKGLSSSDSVAVSVYNDDAWQTAGKMYVGGNVDKPTPFCASILNKPEGKEIVFLYGNSIHVLKDEKSYNISLKEEDVSANYIISSSIEFEYWVFMSHGRGLRYYMYDPDTGSTTWISYFKGHSLSAGLFDQDGGLWVTSLDAGLFYVPAPQQRVYFKDDQQENAKPTSIASFEEGSFYAGYDDGSIFVYHQDDDGLNLVSRIKSRFSGRVADMYFDFKTQRLYSSYNDFDHPLSKKENYKLSPGTPSSDLYLSRGEQSLNYRKFNRSELVAPRKLYASSGSVLRVIDLDEPFGKIRNINYASKQTIDTQVIGLDWDGGYQIGAVDGLYVYDGKESWKKSDVGIPALEGRIVDIKNLPDSTMLYGTRGNGLVFLKQDTSFLIQEKDGLASDMIRSLNVDEQGNIWVCTLTGLSKVTFEGRVPIVRTFRMEHGLPSNEVYQVSILGDEKWLATSAGVVKFAEPALDTFSPAPKIRAVFVNGEKRTLTTTGFSLPAGKQDVSVSFSTINYIQGGNIEYRYRYDQDSPWRYTQAQVANYSNLGAGAYTFEVESRNPDGYWSRPAYLSFEIALPWYKTWTARIGGVLALVAGISIYFLLRERRRKREQDLLFQITQLEHAALHAQMNPHFVFNALNSIQNFVLENDAKQAATYLSRFARVIRQTLRSSVDGRHSLDEELMMLETYLGLEKLRFKQGFSYTVTVDSSLPKHDIVLPPLLIQPFIENAIIHGLKDRKKGGRISVRFAGTVDNLLVVIEDNGKGYNPREQGLKPDSLGMEITRRRLDMMNRAQEDSSGMAVQHLRSETGKPCGTRVTLYIRPLTSTAPAAAPI